MYIDEGTDLLLSIFLPQREDDSLVLSVEPDALTVGQFITEGYFIFLCKPLHFYSRDGAFMLAP